jgi:hypothetical protein
LNLKESADGKSLTKADELLGLDLLILMIWQAYGFRLLHQTAQTGFGPSVAIFFV